MEKIENVPVNPDVKQGHPVMPLMQHEVIKNLSPLQEKVYLLLTTGKFRTVEISNILHIADPRRVIKSLRDRGIVVSDVWDKSEKYKAHFKLYFVRKGLNDE